MPGYTLGRIAMATTAAVAAAGMALALSTGTPSPPRAAAGHLATLRFAVAAEWVGFAGDAQHTAISPQRPQPLRRIRWRARLDHVPLPPPDQGLLVHYGSPMITAANTVLVPTRGTVSGDFRVVAYSGASGARRWSLATDYRLPGFPKGAAVNTPPLPATLMPGDTLAVAGAGGTILIREHANRASAAVRREVFYGAAQWQAHRSAFDKAVRITTPLTGGPDGSVYFGFSVTGPTPDHLTSGIARIDAHGHATWTTVAAAAANRTFTSVALGSAPALSPDGKIVYLALTRPDPAPVGPSGLPNGPQGMLVGVSAATLRPRFHVLLKDPVTGRLAGVALNSSASPTVGPDGDVYFGVLENPLPSHDARGWLLHFNATLTQTRIPGSFGWDDTVSVLPARAVRSYHGTSPYLLVDKYNNYLLGPHGNGQNQVALLDPRAGQQDPYSSTRVMRAVDTMLSPLREPGTSKGSRYEWCINSAVVDPADDSVFVNNEDGILYRWDLASNTLAEQIRLNPPRGEGYTPTLIGPDGTVYAINNGTLYAVGR